MSKTEKMLGKLQNLCWANDLPSHPIIVAMHIAMDYCNDPAMIERYGTIATDKIRQWQDEK